MLTKTHLAITIFAVLALLGFVEHKFLFAISALVATMIPDIDIETSKLGRKWYFRPLQFFVQHRGILHSFIFILVVTFILAVFWPTIALGFFLGYSLHVFSDSFTVMGIQPFYPFGGKISWKIRTGGLVEVGIFVIFCVMNFVLFVRVVLGVVG
jgi:membrane-bound metal-dependent hydrolase YbcI (DUF457 family)